MKILSALLTVLALPAMAQPMWQQADLWRCDLERHMRAPTGQQVLDMEAFGRSFVIDFKAGHVTSAFIQGSAETIHRSYYESREARFNILVNDWGFGQYPSTIVERDGGFWSVQGSGTQNPGDDVWIAIFQCHMAQADG